MATPTGDGHSRLGAKLRDMKNRVHGRSDNGSYASSSTRQSRLTEQQQQPEEGSVIMGASILSSHPGLGPMGWTTGASDLTGGVLGGGGGGGESTLLSNGVGGGGIGTGTKSYNPLASQDEDDSGRIESKLGRTPSLFASETSTAPALNGRSGEEWNSVSSHGDGECPVFVIDFDTIRKSDPSSQSAPLTQCLQHLAFMSPRVTVRGFTSIRWPELGWCFTHCLTVQRSVRRLCCAHSTGLHHLIHCLRAQ